MKERMKEERYCESLRQKDRVQRHEIGGRDFEQQVKKVNELQPFSRIPSTLLWEILGRIPIKTCLTCKLVCREWYRVVTNPKFSSFRRHKASSRFPILFHDFSVADVGFNFNLVELEKALDFNDSGKCFVGVDDLIRFKQKIDPSSKIWHLRSHCNGVVCFASGKVDLFVCHLFTGQYAKLRNMHQIENPSHIPTCELGCCSVSGQFKVLVLIWYEAKKIQVAMIQTLGDGEWRSVGIAPLNIWRGGCFLNGSSHWLDRNYIWSFDFGEETFSQISLPDDVNIGSYEKLNKNLSAFNSCLCLSCSPWGSGVEIDVWIMKEYGVKESWVKQLVILGDPWSMPLMLMDKGKILLRSGYKLYLYDPQTRASKLVNFEAKGPLRCGVNVVFPVGFDVSFSRF